MSRRATEHAVNQVLSSILADRWKDKARTRRIPVDALRAAAARGLSAALRTLARASSPAERFTLSSWAAQVQVDHSSQNKAKP